MAPKEASLRDGVTQEVGLGEGVMLAERRFDGVLGYYDPGPMVSAGLPPDSRKVKRLASMIGFEGVPVSYARSLSLACWQRGDEFACRRSGAYSVAKFRI